MNNFRITIPKECHEDFSKMKKEEKGLWCLSCQKHVVDFSMMSNEEIISYFKNKKDQEVCGTFSSGQLNVPLREKSSFNNRMKKLFSVRFYGFILTLFLTNWFISCKVYRRTGGPVGGDPKLGTGSGMTISEHLESIKTTCEPEESITYRGPAKIETYYKFKKKKTDSTQVISGPDLIIPAVETKENKIVLQFLPGKYEMNSNDKKVLNEFAQILNKKPDAELYIAGYADSTGSEKANKKISKKRAEAVKKLFIENNIENVIHVTWYGEKNFAAENETESGRAKNRRVEVILKEE